MSINKIGPLTIITGQNGSRVPFSTSIIVEGKQDSALIDCGGGQSVFDYIKKSFLINKIYLTHYHLDHIWGAYLFDQADIYINTYDYKKLADPFELANAMGITAFYNKQEVENYVQKHLLSSKSSENIRPKWQPVIGITNHCYPYEKTIDVCGTEMIMIHTPGHTEGFCSPYFPEHGILFVGDYDLTSFGPWYNNADSDIDQFIKSAKRTLETDAKYFVTAHHKGSFNKIDYEKGLEKYIDIIYTREEKTKLAVQQGISPKDIVYQEIFYYIENHKQNRHLMESEIIGIAKHIKRLISQGFPFDDYYQEFISYYHLRKEALHYKSEPVTLST